VPTSTESPGKRPPRPPEPTAFAANVPKRREFDGGFLVNAQELGTAVRLRLDLVVLILQDDVCGMIRWEAGNRRLCRFRHDFRKSRFRRLRESSSRGSARVETADGLVPALEDAFRQGSVQLVAVPIDYSENTRVLVDELGKHAFSHPLDRLGPLSRGVG